MAHFRAVNHDTFKAERIELWSTQVKKSAYLENTLPWTSNPSSKAFVSLGIKLQLIIWTAISTVDGGRLPSESEATAQAWLTSFHHIFPRFPNVSENCSNSAIQTAHHQLMLSLYGSAEGSWHQRGWKPATLPGFKLERRLSDPEDRHDMSICSCGA